jgi:hypothetical protein
MADRVRFEPMVELYEHGAHRPIPASYRVRQLPQKVAQERIVMSNYVQPDFRNPSPTPAPTCANGINADPLGTSIAPVNYLEPTLDDKIDPHRTGRGPGKTKLGF